MKPKENKIIEEDIIEISKEIPGKYFQIRICLFIFIVCQHDKLQFVQSQISNCFMSMS